MSTIKADDADAIFDAMFGKTPTSKKDISTKPISKMHIGKLPTRSAPVEENFTKVDNEVFKLAEKLNQSEFTIYLILYRYSYGFHKDTVQIGYTALRNKTGTSTRTLKRAIPNLIELGLIEILKEARQGSQGTIYKVNLPISNKHISKDNISDKPIGKMHTEPISKMPIGKTNIDIEKPASNSNGKMPIGKMHTQQRDVLKDNNKDSDVLLKYFDHKTLENLKKDIPSLDWLIQWHNYIQNQDIENPSGYLRAAIENKWPAPNNLSSKQQDKIDEEIEKRQEEWAKLEKEKDPQKNKDHIRRIRQALTHS